MNYRNLGRTGVKVSVLGLGTENFGPRTSEADACEIVDRALAEGVNLIDTANFYGTEDPGDYSERRGQSERIVGSALKRNGKLLDCRTSIGSAVALGSGASPEELQKQADLALYHSKTSGRGAFRMFVPALRQESQRTASALDVAARAIASEANNCDCASTNSQRYS